MGWRHVLQRASCNSELRVARIRVGQEPTVHVFSNMECGITLSHMKGLKSSFGY